MLLTIPIILNLHVIIDQKSADVVAAQKENVESKQYIKQVAQAIDKISKNMAKESNESILEQLHEHFDEFFKAVKAGNTSFAHFASSKSLAEELMVNHAQQPTKRFTGKGAQKYKCPYCTQLYETTDHRTEHVFFKHMEELLSLIHI